MAGTEVINVYTEPGEKIIDVLSNVITNVASKTPIGNEAQLAINIFANGDAAVYSTNVDIANNVGTLQEIKFTNTSVALISMLTNDACTAMADSLVCLAIGAETVGAAVSAPGIAAISLGVLFALGVGAAAKYLAGEVYDHFIIKTKETTLEGNKTTNEGNLTTTETDSQKILDIEHSVITGLGLSLVKCGTAGNDIMWGGNGNDSLAGEAGNDTLFGGNVIYLKNYKAPKCA